MSPESSSAAASRGGRLLDRLSEAIYLAAIFLIPVWFAYWYPTYNIFDLNKLAIFRILVALLSVTTGLRILLYPPARSEALGRFFKKYWLAPLIFIVGLSLTLFGALNPVVSFYGTPQRQAGLLSYLLYFWWFILLSFNLGLAAPAAAGPKVRRIIITAGLSGTLVALYGVLQFLNIDFLTWPEPAFLTQRTFSSLGQPNFLASWLLLIIPLAVYLIYISRHSWWRWAWGLALVIQFLALIMTGSRGGLLALGGAGFLLFVYWLFRSSRTRRQKSSVAVIFVAALLLAALGLNYFSPGRLAALTQDTGSLAVRVQLYEAAGNAILERPFLGYGLENGDQVFIRYYRPDWGIYGDVAQSADRAHDLFLDILLAAGLAGLLLYSLLYYFTFDLIRNNLRTPATRPLTLALAAGLAGYLISLLVSFSFVSGEVYFWSFLALLVVLAAKSSGQTAEPPLTEATASRRFERDFPFPLKILLAALILVLAGWQIIRAGQDLSADHYFNDVYQAFNRQDYVAVLGLANRLDKSGANPVNRTFYISWLAQQLSPVYLNGGWPDSARAALLTQFVTWNKILPATGYVNQLARAWLAIAVGDFSEARSNLGAVQTLSPNWPPVYLAQGALAVARSDWTNALLSYYIASDNLPSPNDPRLNREHRAAVLYYDYLLDKRIAAVYLEKKQYAIAADYYGRAYRSQPSDYTLLKDIADTYYRRGDLAAAISYNQHGWERAPQDYHWPLALALLAEDQGDRTAAENYLQAALRLAPSDPTVLSLQNKFKKP